MDSFKEEDQLSGGLEAMILARQKGRADDFLAGLEAKYAKEPKTRKSRSPKKTSTKLTKKISPPKNKGKVTDKKSPKGPGILKKEKPKVAKKRKSVAFDAETKSDKKSRPSFAMRAVYKSTPHPSHKSFSRTNAEKNNIQFVPSKMRGLPK